MSAHDQIRAMLDQLMGSAGGSDGMATEERPDNNSTDLKYNNPSVCRAHLLGYCPHEILTGTRMELGPCSLIHSLALRADYNRDLIANPNLVQDFIHDAIDKLEQFIKESDRRTASAQKKLDDQNLELKTPEVLEKEKLVASLGEEIGKKLLEAEELGSSGEIEKSLSTLSEIEELKLRKANAEIDYKKSIPPAALQQQKLRVCIVCSSYLGVNDNDRRLADHFGGKLHLGYIKLREGYEEMKAKVAEIGGRRAAQSSSKEHHHSNRYHGKDDRDKYHGNSNYRGRDREPHRDSRDHNNYKGREQDRHGNSNRKYYGNRRRRSRSRSPI